VALWAGALFRSRTQCIQPSSTLGWFWSIRHCACRVRISLSKSAVRGSDPVACVSCIQSVNTATSPPSLFLAQRHGVQRGIESNRKWMYFQYIRCITQKFHTVINKERCYQHLPLPSEVINTYHFPSEVTNTYHFPSEVTNTYRFPSEVTNT